MDPSKHPNVGKYASLMERLGMGFGGSRHVQPEQVDRWIRHCDKSRFRGNPSRFLGAVPTTPDECQTAKLDGLKRSRWQS